ncbi:hypothetical protein RHGRI_009088 [Rhododendron griersonianum]|uniref:Signal peptidase complex catalytic subunit SEC11 n=1 Tax=Rhododendron griersonianum TaxID=479676 RepID=A0AAV6L414_9ERIC|nr:hypothetical protein RHGRI_009088 [Rhododendron griersonianum]
MGWIGEAVDSVKSLRIRQVLSQAVSLGMIVTSALIIWKGLMCVTGSESPVVVVLSGSMEPGFKRGDILFLHMSKDPIRAGEIVVFNVDVHERQDTEDVDVLTKGTAVVCPILELVYLSDIFLQHISRRDTFYPSEVRIGMKPNLKEMKPKKTTGDNNMGDDRPLYAHSQLWLQRHHIMGRAVGFLPYVGWVTIIMTEKPIIKYLLIGALGLLVITSKE